MGFPIHNLTLIIFFPSSKGFISHLWIKLISYNFTFYVNSLYFSAQLLIKPFYFLLYMKCLLKYHIEDREEKILHMVGFDKSLFQIVVFLVFGAIPQRT